MNLITNFFLRAKHWQMFLLLFAVPTIAEIALLSSMPETIRSPRDLGEAGLLFLGLMMFYIICFLGWLWSMGSFLSSIVEPTLKLKMGFFRIAVAYPAFYLPLFSLVFLRPEPGHMAIIVPLHLFAMFCMFYCLYFVAKNLVLVERGNPASFYDYAGPLFLVWFYPLGIWAIQPRINRLYEERRRAEPLAGANAV